MDFKKTVIMLIIIGGFLMKPDLIKAETLNYKNVFQSLGILSEYEPIELMELTSLFLDKDETKEVTTVLNEPVEEVVTVSSTKDEEKEEEWEIEEIDTLDILARIIEAEAKGESYEGKVAVGQVVLNRVNDQQFPNTVYDVIYQPRQFEPVMNGAINNEATEESVHAAIEALKGEGPVSEALYFYNPAIAYGQDWFNTLEFVEEIGNHVFRK